MADQSDIIGKTPEEATCLQLAIDGQRLCRGGDIKTGIYFFESALVQGTDDLNILTVVYSQLGNAYFSLRDYNKSLHFHKLDLDLSRRLNDVVGEAKACGNLGNTLKMLGKYEEALACCEMHLKLARQLEDRAGVARALYNLANVYHQKAKASGAIGRQDMGQFPHHIQEALEKAATYYEENLTICKDIGDRATQGLACGNLANTHYLLGNFQRAVELHTERLVIAKEFGHRAAERRAYSNRGNAYIFLANFEAAIEDYRSALHLARELDDETLEAQVCYSLGNTYYILRRYPDAAACLEQHLRIAKQLGDKVGEARAYWSLTNIHCDHGDLRRAKFCASLHLQIAAELNDSMEVNTAKDNLAKLDVLIHQQEGQEAGSSSGSVVNGNGDHVSTEIGRDFSKLALDRSIQNPASRMAKNNLNGKFNGASSSTSSAAAATPSVAVTGTVLSRNVGGSLKVPCGNVPSSSSGGGLVKSSSQGNVASTSASGAAGNQPLLLEDEDAFFQLLSKFQSRRMDEQRCSIPDEDGAPAELMSEEATTQFLELVAGVQGSRMNDQRASVPEEFPGLRASPSVLSRLMPSGDHHHSGGGPGLDSASPGDAEDGGPSEALLEMIARCQASRINDQRSSLPPPPTTIPSGNGQITSSSTVPDEDLMALIQRLSSYRLDEQRCSPPFPMPVLTLAHTSITSVSASGAPLDPATTSQSVPRGVVDDSDGLPEPAMGGETAGCSRGSRRRR